MSVEKSDATVNALIAGKMIILALLIYVQTGLSLRMSVKKLNREISQLSVKLNG